MTPDLDSDLDAKILQILLQPIFAMKERGKEKEKFKSGPTGLSLDTIDSRLVFFYFLFQINNCQLFLSLVNFREKMLKSNMKIKFDATKDALIKNMPAASRKIRFGDNFGDKLSKYLTGALKVFKFTPSFMDLTFGEPVIRFL